VVGAAYKTGVDLCGEAFSWWCVTERERVDQTVGDEL
jgi:hypothetical protein